MSRPISIEDLLKQSQPKFIKKTDRVPKTRVTKIITKSKPRPTLESESLVEHKQIKKKPKKFNFDWDETDDTSSEFQPMVEVEFDDDLEDGGGNWRQKAVTKMNKRDWRAFNEEFNIKITNCDIKPIRSWKESDINPKLIKILISLGYTDPTPIQRAAIPIALKFNDIIGIAETGSGKTLAYIIPLIDYILKIDENYLKYEHQETRNANKPLGLILAPTRELANQITGELTKICDKLGLRSISIIGGHEYEETRKAVAKGIHIIVATPGRLIDSIDKNLINLSHCNYVIFDEADRMIDMGFENDVEKLYSFLPTNVDPFFNVSRRLTGMYSATFSDAINKLTNKYLNLPARLVIGQVGEKVDNIIQRFEFVEDDQTKLYKLFEVIGSHKSVIIFANYIKVVEQLSEFLTSNNLRNATLHGSKSQLSRERVIDDFSKQKVPILVATDVAARGIDIANVSLVINYQMTKKLDEYIHRIGRTGRAGVKGNSYTFLGPEDEELFGDLNRFLKRNAPSWLQKYNTHQTIRD